MHTIFKDLYILDDGNLAVMVTRNATPRGLMCMQDHDGVGQSYFTFSLKEQ